MKVYFISKVRAYTWPILFSKSFFSRQLISRIEVKKFHPSKFIFLKSFIHL